MEVLEFGTTLDDLNGICNTCPGWCEYNPDTNCWRDAD